MAGQRSLQQQLAQIHTKYADRLGLSLFGQLGANLALEGWEQQPLVAVLNSGAQRVIPDGVLTEDPAVDALAVICVVDGHADFQAAFLFATVDCENAV